MTLKNAIKRMITEYPMLFQDRVQCLDHLFCVIGNGYDWKNGQLVIPKYVRDEEKLSKKKRPVENRLIDGEQMIQQMLDCQPGKWVTTKNFIDKEYSLNSFTQGLLIEFFRRERALRNIDKICTPGFHEWVPTEYRFYPICGYSKFLNLPKDIKPDWLEGAKETLGLVKKYGCAPEYKVDAKKLELKYNEVTR